MLRKYAFVLVGLLIGFLAGLAWQSHKDYERRKPALEYARRSVDEAISRMNLLEYADYVAFCDELDAEMQEEQEIA